jgi:hypothetical protein
MGVLLTLFHSRQLVESKKITTKIAFVVDPSRPVPEGTTTKLIFIMMGAQAGMDIPAE